MRPRSAWCRGEGGEKDEKGEKGEKGEKDQVRAAELVAAALWPSACLCSLQLLLLSLEAAFLLGADSSSRPLRIPEDLGTLVQFLCTAPGSQTRERCKRSGHLQDIAHSCGKGVQHCGAQEILPRGASSVHIVTAGGEKGS